MYHRTHGLTFNPATRRGRVTSRGDELDASLIATVANSPDQQMDDQRALRRIQHMRELNEDRRSPER